nr:importin-5-like [Ipomoea batatas]
MPLLLRSALENELRFPVSVDSPIITLPKIIIPALVQALEAPTIKLQVQALVALNKIMQIAKTWALDNDEIIGNIWKQKDTTPEERRMTFDIFHCIAEEFKEQGLSTLTNTWLKKLLFVLKGKSVSSFVVKKLTCTRLSTQNIITEIVYLKIMWQKDTTPEERRMTFDIFHCIAEEFKEQGLRSYAKYIPFLFEASKDTVPDIQQILSICLQIATRAIGIYVEFDRETHSNIVYSRSDLQIDCLFWNSYFSTLTNTLLKKLLFVLKGKSVSSFVVKKLTCTRHWIDEAKTAHELLCSIVEKLKVDYPHITQTTPIFSSFNNLVKMTDNTKSVASMGKDPMCSS